MWTADNESEGRAGEKRRTAPTHRGECLLHFQRVENCLQRTTNRIHLVPSRRKRLVLGTLRGNLKG